jgi:hypothetical protein
MNSLLKVYWNLVFNLTGRDVSFDAEYKDFSFYSIEFRASCQEVKKLLIERHFIPKEIAPDETRLQIIGCEFRAVQIAGPYNEIAIQVPVEPLGDSPGDKFAHLFLPVTTEAARWPGVAIFGFPKFIAKIDFTKDENRVTCQLAADEELILEFGMVDIVGTKKQARWEFYGNRKQRIVKTAFDLKGLISEEAGGNVSFVLGKHRIAETIRGLLLSNEVVRTSIGHNISGVLRKPVRIEMK